MFHTGLASAAPNASTATPAVTRGPASIAVKNGAATNVPTIAADSLDSATSAATHAPSVSSPAIAPVALSARPPAGPGLHERSLWSHPNMPGAGPPQQDLRPRQSTVRVAPG